MKPEDEKEIQDQVDRMVKHLSNEKSKAMKETEETLKKIYESVYKKLFSTKGNDIIRHYDKSEFELCEAYHQERMKSILPSEQDLRRIAFENCGEISYHGLYFIKGMKYILELLTKGGK